MMFVSLHHQIMTATVETVQEQLDVAAIMPAEKVLPAVARSVTLTETDTGKINHLYLCVIRILIM